MATLKDILRKIGAVKKTKQITRAMNMVAAARLRGAQSKMENFEPYARKFSEVLGNLSSRLEPDIHPLLTPKEEIKKIRVVLMTSDRGLCGSFNMNLINRAEKLLKQKQAAGMEVDLTCIGKKGRDFFRRKPYPINSEYVGILGRVEIGLVNNIASSFIKAFLGEVEPVVDEVYLVYSRFMGMSKQVPDVVKLLPITPPDQSETAQFGPTLEYLCEPSAASLMIDLLPKHISVQIYNAFLQTETSEHAARMASMDNATKNCNEMVQNLTLVYNKARQAAITKELMDIVGGAEALK
ncbi:MAG: ATP synthase F1 subunit gamma [Deltaproteobacteria bacterium]|nr:ATP synthase F1 subunit gamma [Deltaproteobacteria bacterium]